MTHRDPRIDAVCAALGPPSPVQGEDVRWTMPDRLAHYDCPAVSVATFESGELAWAEAFGVLEKGKPAAARADSLFSGASISKPVTAVLALQLVDEGRLDLDVDVNRFLTGWKLPQNAFTHRAPVTLRRLLSHTAGTTVAGFGGFPPDAKLPSVIDVLEGRPPALTPPVRVDKRPGQSVRYSGGGTMIVQMVLEEATGLPFAELARQRVLEPLGMTRTTFANPLPKSLRENAAVGHEGGASIPGKWVCVPQLAAGGIWTTATDYARFMIACREAWLGRPRALIRQELAAQMMSSQGGGFGIAWEVTGEGVTRRFSHGGSNDGYQCETMALLESGDGAVVLTNAGSGLFLYWEVFAAIARVHAWPGFMPGPRIVDPIQPDEFPRYTGVYDIISGVEAPELQLWEQGGQLLTHIPGMRGGPNETLRDERGRLFNPRRPSETEVLFDETGRAETMILRLFGSAEIMRVRRRA